MPELQVDGRTVSVPAGSTLLDAAGRLGIPVPTLCFAEGLPHHTSCMVCLVEDVGADRLVPACAAQAEEGQRVRTSGERVGAARRRAIDLLLSEHAGDCEAPCVRACPAHADIPGMARRLGRGDLTGALAAMLVRLPLAGSLAAVCPAPCQRACRRAGVDSPVAICALKRTAARAGLGAAAGAAGAAPYTPAAAPPNGKRVAVVGAGPAGLSAAYFLSLAGCRCTVIDQADGPGGLLRRAVPTERLPADLFDADVALLTRLGVELHSGESVAPGDRLADLRERYDALVLATGSVETREELLGHESAVDPGTGATDLPGVFAGGNAARKPPTRMAVRAVADGRMAAGSVISFLAGSRPLPLPRRFDSRRGAMRPEDLALLAGDAEDRAARVRRAPARPSPTSEEMSREARSALEAAAAEAFRCLDCGCSRGQTCILRSLAEEWGADGRCFPRDGAPAFERLRGKGGLSFEPGKCVRCGICVRVAERGGDRPGLAFTGRGAEARVRVPFGGDIGEALPATASECVARCPTGALAWDR